jgi:hypothetical protein
MIRKGGIMSTVSRDNRCRVQRLRGVWSDTPAPPGSRGCDPGKLRSLLTMSCSNPRRDCVSPGQLGPGSATRAPLREHARKPCPCEKRGATVGLQSTGQNRCVLLAKGHCTLFPAAQGQRRRGWEMGFKPNPLPFPSTACWREARTGTFPPLLSQPP